MNPPRGRIVMMGAIDKRAAKLLDVVDLQPSSGKTYVLLEAEIADVRRMPMFCEVEVIKAGERVG
jgi:hypothetical protein